MDLERGRRGHAVDAALAAGGLAYSAALALLSFQYSFEARLFALVAAAAGIATSIAYLVSSLRAYAAELPDPATTSDERREGAERTRRLILTTAFVVASIPLLYLFGIHAYGFAFVVVFLRFFARHPVRATLGVASGLTLFNYLLFTIVFDMKFDNVGVLLP
jgi:hypothetical protein